MIGDLTVKLSADTSDLVIPVEQAQVKIDGISGSATMAQLQLNTMGTAMLGVSRAANSLSFVSNHLLAIGTFSGLAGKGLYYVSSAIGFVGAIAFQVATAIKLLLIPIKALFSAVKLLLLPFKFLISLMTLLAKAVIAVVKPMVSLAIFAFKVKVAMTALGIQFKMIRDFLAMLSPRMRVLVLGLTALGLAGNAGSAAMNLMAKAMKLASFAVLSLTKPIAALKVLMISTTLTMVKFTFSVIAASRALASMAISGTISGILALGKATLSVASSIGNNLVSAASSAVKTLALLGIAGVGWGIKLFADAEKAETAFTTMLKSGTAAKIVLAELEQFAASTPFQLKSLQDGAKQLLNAQVPTDQLTKKLRILGDIAAGTGKPINDFARIYSKVKATGKVSLESLNQLAERGVPIYSALADQLGVSRKEMLSMISKGKVGFTDLDAAITATATGTGVFAGGMAAQSQTIGGLFSTLKDNIAFAFRELGMQVSESFNLKGLLNRTISFFQGLKGSIASMQPVFTAIATTAHAAFSSLWEVVSVVFNSITSATGTAGMDIQKTLMEVLAVANWIFKSWPDIAEMAFMKMVLFAVQAFEQIKYYLTTVIPTTLLWFANNWQSIFFTATDYVLTVFINLGNNLRSIWSGIVSFISGNGFKVDFTPITEGFRSSIQTLPDIPDRIIGQAEKNLNKTVDGMTDRVANSLKNEIDKNMATLDAFRNKKPETISNDFGTLPDKQEQDSFSTPKEKQSLGIIEKGSQEAFKLIFGNQNKPQIAEAKKQTGLMKKVVENTSPKNNISGGGSFKIQGAV